MARPRNTEDARYIPAQRRRTGTDGRSATVEQLQSETLKLFAEGHTVESAMAKVGRQPATYQQWRKRYPGYAAKVDRVRARIAGRDTTEIGDFAEFRRKYLGVETFRHQYQWIDCLEGIEPRELHENQIYHPGRKNRILINTPPNHGKSTTITMDYATYRICKDPNVRIIVISQSQEMAKKMLHGIKMRLTGPKFEALQTDFAPAGGFKSGSTSWRETMIYVGAKNDAEKDPTVEALGVGGQVYGARADLIILDDIITMKTARTTGQRDKLLDWIRTEVSSRLHVDGKLLIVGTRLTGTDLYHEIIRQDERQVWTYLTQPAILEWGDTPEEHLTLWPERWNGPALDEIVAEHGTDMARFRLVYQQEQAAEDAIFPQEAVEGCCYKGNVGPLSPATRPLGMQGLYVVAGLDPAASGFTAIVVLGLDKRSGMRYVLDVINQRGIRPHELKAKMLDLTRRYGVKEWRVEKNGLQTLLTQDADLRSGLIGLGSRLHEHHTVKLGQTGKWDADFGVASLAPLILGAMEVPKSNKLHIPNNHTHRGIRALVDQLIAFEPNTESKTDVVMALWFADLACRKALERGAATHMKNPFLTVGQAQRRQVININDFLERRDLGLSG